MVSILENKTGGQTKEIIFRSAENPVRVEFGEQIHKGSEVKARHEASHLAITNEGVRVVRILRSRGIANEVSHTHPIQSAHPKQEGKYPLPTFPTMRSTN